MSETRGPNRVAVTGSTGVAAANVGGITLHSFAGIGLGKQPLGVLISEVYKNKKAVDRWLRTSTLIIDESKSSIQFAQHTVSHARQFP